MARERKTRTPAAPAAAPVAASRGRTNPQNEERLEHILARTKEEPGILSATLAQEMDITSLQCSQLTDRLVKRGDIEIFKLANGARSNYLPKDLNKVRARLEKQREAELANREANADEAKAEKFKVLKEKAAAKKAAAASETKKTSKTPAASTAPRRRKTG